MCFGKPVDDRLHRTGLQCVERGWEQRGEENASFLVGITRDGGGINEVGELRRTSRLDMPI